MKIFRGVDDAQIEILAVLAGGGEETLKLLELAGRTAYQSQAKITRDSARKFIRMLRSLGHESVLEHSAMTVRFKNCSRGFTHELVRHRLASFTQESTRYVDESDFEVVLPPAADDPAAMRLTLPLSAGGTVEAGLDEWLMLNEAVYRKLRSGDYRVAAAGGETHKGKPWRPEDARQLLPTGICAEIVVTANLREWRHIFALRCSKASHWEIRGVMCRLLEMARKRVPVIFDDFRQEGLDKNGIPFYSRGGA
ncbi:MAG TPA: FAD-dependent thymidylate synthase [bacterium]|nr:FAD-dependent thymidylate synthase [bacterium]